MLFIRLFLKIFAEFIILLHYGSEITKKALRIYAELK